MANPLAVFNKYVTNRVMGRFAGAPRGPFAKVLHVGRRSGNHYETPIIAEPVADGFMIALTYGLNVDWYCNVVAAGGCHLLWHAKTYTIERVEEITPREALPHFSPAERIILRLLRTHHFIKMVSTEPPAA